MIIELGYVQLYVCFVLLRVYLWLDVFELGVDYYLDVIRLYEPHYQIYVVFNQYAMLTTKLPWNLSFFLCNFALVKLLFQGVWDFVPRLQLFLLPQPQLLHISTQNMCASLRFYHLLVKLYKHEWLDYPITQDLRWSLGYYVIKRSPVLILAYD